MVKNQMPFLLVASLVFERLVSFIIGLPSLSSIVAFGWLTIASVTARQRVAPIFTLVVGYVGIAILATLITVVQYNQIDLSSFARGLTFFITPFVCFHLFYNQPHLLPRLVAVIIIFATMNSLAVLLQYWGLEYYGYGLQGDEVLTFDAIAKYTDSGGAIRVRPPGVIGNYHEAALLGVVGLIALLIKITRNSVTTVRDLLLSVFILIGIYATFSRANLFVALVFFGAILTCFLFNKTYWKPLHQVIGNGVSLIALIFAADYLFSTGILSTLVSYAWDLPDVVDATERSVMLVESFVALTHASPLVGLGFGYAGRAAIGTTPVIDVNLIDYSIIALLSDAGILGCGVLLYFLVAVHLRTTIRYQGITLLILVGFFISLLFGDFFTGKLSRHLVFSLLGGLLGESVRND